MCHHANAHCTQPYVALNNLRVVAGVGGRRMLCGEGDESRPEPIVPLSVCYACRAAQISHEAHPAAVHSFVSLPHPPRSGRRRSRRRRAPVPHPASSIPPHLPLPRLPCGRYTVIC